MTMFFDFFYQSPDAQQNIVVKWERAEIGTHFQSNIFYVTCMYVICFTLPKNVDKFPIGDPTLNFKQ